MATNDGGFIGQDGLNAPDSPTGVSGSAGNAQVSVSFTAPSDTGGSAITGYRAQSNDGIGASGSSSPVTVTGLTNGTSYTFNVWAINAFGYSAPSDASGSVTPQAPARAAFFGGYSSSFAFTNTIQYVTIETTGNASDFGDLTQSIFQMAKGCAGSRTRSLRFGGSTTGGDAGAVNVIDYWNLASTGNATDFGDLAVDIWSNMSLSDSTRALSAGGTNDSGSQVNTINYVTIDTTGNSTDFGDLTHANNNGSGMASATRGIIGLSASYGTIDYVTIQSTGNAADFGSFTTTTSYYATASNGTRGLFAGGYITGSDFSNVIEYITIASTGNTTDFGDLSQGRNGVAGAGGDTRAVFGGGYISGAMSDTMDYVTISTTGNAADFGNLLASSGWWRTGAASSGHGGLS